MKIILTSLTITLVLLATSITHAQEVGTLPGVVSVSPSGAATYTIPIDLPPGRAGMEPGIALTYNSQAGNGLLGIGWSISGLSGITRVGTTLYHDDFIDGVDFDDNDRFALDGNRLIAINTQATEFRTELETFSKIVANGTAGNGPQWFQVYTKDGLILEYGNTGDSRIEADGRSDILFWNLNKVEDRQGNYIEFEYSEENGYGRISNIYYSEHTSSPNESMYTVEFGYSPRDDVIENYIAGCKIGIDKLLDEIKIKYNEQLIKTYDLTYEDDFYAHLKNVKLTDADNESLIPTTFVWGTAPGSFNLGWTGIVNEGPDADYTMGDFNGDGNTDILCVYHSAQRAVQEFDKVTIYYSLDDGTFEAYDDSLGDYLDDFLYFLSGDYNGDGRTDLARIESSNYKIYFGKEEFENGSGFSHKTGGSYNHMSKHYFANVDLNGNGKEELLFVKYNNPLNPPHNTYFYSVVAAKEYNAETNSMETLINVDGYDHYRYSHTEDDLSPIYVGDFTGDGKTNLLINFDDDESKIMELATNTTSLVPINEQVYTFPTKNYRVFPGDFNGDGIMDILTRNKEYSTWEVHYFNGEDEWIHGISPITIPEGDQTTYFEDFQYMISDYNGDGKSDILQTYKESYDPGHGDPLEFVQSHFILHYSNGINYSKDSTAYDTKNAILERPYPQNDFNGDGKMDCFIDDRNESINDDFRVLYFYQDGQSNLVQKVTNGLGVSTEIVYQPLTNSDIYTKGNGAIFPVIDLQFPWYVAIKTNTDNGFDGYFTTDYK